MTTVTAGGSDGSDGKPKKGRRRARKKLQDRTRALSVPADLRRSEVLRLALCLTPITAIAVRLEMTRGQVARILDEPEVRTGIAAAERTAMRDAIARRRQLTRRAVEVMAEELESEHGHVRLRAAELIMSGSGADAPKRFDIGILAGSTDAELWRELEELEDALGESADDPASPPPPALEADTSTKPGPT